MSETRINESQGSLLSIVFPSGGECNYHWGGSSNNPIRDGIAKIFDANQDYTFLRSIANPDAVSLIKENSKDLVIKRGLDPEEFTEKFDRFLMNTYMKALGTVANNQKIAHFVYPLVKADGQDSHVEEVSWPVIHVIPGSENVQIYKSLLENLNQDKVQKVIRKNELPQNYQIHKVNLISERGVNPLVIQQRNWTVKGRELRNAIDFLIQFHFYQGFDNTSASED